MRKSLAVLLGGSLTIWLAVLYPASQLGGTPAVVFSAVAGLSCLVPTMATLIWCHHALKGSPEQQLLAVLGGMGVRIVFVIGAGMALFYLSPYFHYRSFWLWVIAFYLVTLTLEIGLLVGRVSGTDRSRNP